MSNVSKAAQCFRDGCACSQAILAVYGSPLGLSREHAMQIAAGFAGGMRLGDTCGAVTGAFMVLGMRHGSEDSHTAEGRGEVYRRVVEFTERFKKRNGSVVCRELLGCDISTPEGMKQAQGQGLFESTCVRMVEDAAEILEEMGVEAGHSCPTPTARTAERPSCARQATDMHQDPAAAFLKESTMRVTISRDWICHCLGQLEDQDIWWTPQEGCNSTGIVIQHLLGSLRQWVLSGLRGDQDVRNRSEEFVTRLTMPKAVVMSQFNELIDQVTATLAGLDPSLVLQERTIQGRTCTILSAVYRTVAHLELHAGQIALLAKLRLADNYREWWHTSEETRA